MIEQIIARWILDAEPGDSKRFRVHDIAASRLGKHPDMDKALRNFVSNTNQNSRARPAKFLVRRYDSENVYEIFCRNPFRPGTLPPSECVGRPRQWHFDTAQPGHEFEYACSPRDFNKVSSRIRSAASRQGARVSIRKVRSDEPHLRVRVTSRRTPASKYPFATAEVGDEFFFPVAVQHMRKTRMNLINAARHFRRKIALREGANRNGTEGLWIRVTSKTEPKSVHATEATNPFLTDKTIEEGTQLFFPARVEDVETLRNNLYYWARKARTRISTRKGAKKNEHGIVEQGLYVTVKFHVRRSPTEDDYDLALMLT